MDSRLFRRLVATASLFSLVACQARPDPSIFLILVDALRADHLGTYGYPADTSPNIDSFAAEATVFENAYSQAPHTIPSVLQIMTGRYDQGWTIDRGSPTVAEILKGFGYETVAIVDNPHFEFLKHPHGVRRGFDTFYRNPLLDRDSVENQLWKANTPADAITAQATRFLQRREAGDRKDDPLFLWLHYFDPHDPYSPPYSDEMEELSWEAPSAYTGDIRVMSIFRKGRTEPSKPFSEVDRQHIIDLYDAEIRYLDQSLGELFEFLKDRGLYDSSLIILSADHGESLGEHGNWTHGRSVYDPEIHIPLIVKSPRQKEGTRVTAPAQAIDILPTIVGVLGLEWAFSGRSLLGETVAPAFVFWKKHRVVRTDEWKLIREDKVELFRIEVDPGETNDLSRERPEVVRELTAMIDAKLAEVGRTFWDLDDITEEAVDRMRAIGYME